MSDQIHAKGRLNNDEFKDMSELVYTPYIGEKRIQAVCETEDIAILVALAHKYEGPNSKFATMACRMLKIDSVWAE